MFMNNATTVIILQVSRFRIGGKARIPLERASITMDIYVKFHLFHRGHGKLWGSKAGPGFLGRGSALGQSGASGDLEESASRHLVAWCLVLVPWFLVLGSWCLALSDWCWVLDAWCLLSQWDVDVELGGSSLYEEGGAKHSPQGPVESSYAEKFFDYLQNMSRSFDLHECIQYQSF